MITTTLYSHSVSPMVTQYLNRVSPQPKHLCVNCGSCTEGRCDFFDRPVDKEYNRCFNHTDYHPQYTKYREPANLADIVKEKEKKARQRYEAIA